MISDFDERMTSRARVCVRAFSRGSWTLSQQFHSNCYPPQEKSLENLMIITANAQEHTAHHQRFTAYHRLCFTKSCYVYCHEKLRIMNESRPLFRLPVQEIATRRRMLSRHCDIGTKSFSLCAILRTVRRHTLLFQSYFGLFPLSPFSERSKLKRSAKISFPVTERPTAGTCQR